MKRPMSLPSSPEEQEHPSSRPMSPAAATPEVLAYTESDEDNKFFLGGSLPSDVGSGSNSEESTPWASSVSREEALGVQIEFEGEEGS